jgi:O-antigen ligase
MNSSARSMRAAGWRRSAPALRAPGQSSAAADGQLGIVRDPLRVLLLLLTILTISRIHQHFPQLARLRPALLLVVAATGYAYLNPRFLSRVNVLALWPMRLVALLGVLACCSTVFGISLGRSASFILDTYVKVLAYAFLLAVSIRHVRDLYTYVWAYVIGCGILSFFALFVFGISATGNSDFARLSNLYTFDANDICVVLMVGAPMALLLLVSRRGGWRERAILLMVLVGISASIARSGSRGGFLGFIAVSTAALILANNWSVGRRTSILVVAIVALLFGAPAGYWKQMGTMLQAKDDYNYSSVDGRKALAERGIGYMTSYPLFGLGIDNFSRAECTIGPKVETLEAAGGPIRCRPPHNSYVEAGAELGIPGLLTWVSLVVGVIFLPLRLRGRLPRSWRRGTEAERFMYGATSFLPMSMIGFAVTAFFVTFAWLDPIYILAAFTAGLYIAIRNHGQQTPSAETVSTVSRRRVERGTAGWRVAQSTRNLACQPDSRGV